LEHPPSDIEDDATRMPQTADPQIVENADKVVQHHFYNFLDLRAGLMIL
jgi:hypothetical protein